VKLDFVNVALHLPAAARDRPHAIAVACPAGRDRAGRRAYSHLTCQQLDQESDRIAHGLHALGIRRGTRTALMVPPSLEFFALTFALFKLGAVLVLIDPGMGIRHLGRCLGEAEPEAFIGVRKAHLARRLLGWARQSVRITIGVGSRLFCQHSLDAVRQSEPERQRGVLDVPSLALGLGQVTSDETAAILFTSGSTGIAKGAVYSHGIFAAQVEALRNLYGIEPGEVDLATFPLFALFAPALGMTAVIPDMDPTRPARVHPPNIIEAINDWGVTNMFGSPALLNAVSRWGVAHDVKLPSLRRVISAGAPVPAAVIERMTRMLGPNAEVFTPYGATECLPVASIGGREILDETRHKTDIGAGVCVGRPVQGVDVAIIPVTAEPIANWDDSLRLPPNQIGEITVTGPFVTRSYHARPEATALAKIAGSRQQAAGSEKPALLPAACCLLPAVWHRMGDLGYLDDGGRLWFCGRKAHRVTTPTGPLDTIPVEAVFNTHTAVARTALVGVGPPRNQLPVLCVELEAAMRGADRATLTRELLAVGAKHEHTRGVTHILYHPAFPVDVRHNAKIFREKLAVWAAKRVRKLPPPPACGTLTPDTGSGPSQVAAHGPPD
jgi:acyl-CoA synthetase (AMP-forming)/AMP-acid ligase II